MAIRMPLLLDIIIRFSLGSGQRRFTRFVAMASLIGMMLGVAALIMVLSVMNGFSGELHQRLLSVTPDLVLEPSTPTEDGLSELARRAAERPSVLAATPFQRATTLLQAGGRTRGATLIGAPTEGLSSVVNLGVHLVSGELDALASQPFSVILGTDLARLLRVAPGDEVEVFLPRLTVSPLGVYPKTRKLTVVGLFSVGAGPDAREAYVSYETARRLLGKSGRRGVQIKLTDRGLAMTDRATFQSLDSAPMILSDWTTSQGSLFAAIKMEKITVGILLTSVILVAAFNLISTLTMSVTEKRGDIAILQVIGLSTRQLLLLFLGHGLLLSVVGIALGAALGIGLAVFISDLSLWFEQAVGIVLFDPAVYYIGGLPSILLWHDVAAVIVTALTLSAVAAVYPAWRASRIPAAEVLNYV
ncbi:ABC transporter permease [Luminiphilus sp.]|jgi:lipoprotein-releasing system permease protein|nr:ABC transporter permease [Luminiphilus sp.]